MNNAGILSALDWCAANHVSVPKDTLAKIKAKGIHIPMALKADGDISDVNATYHDEITEALTGYFEEGGSVTAPKSAFKRAVTEAFGAAFDTGWVDGGGELPADEDALGWFNARVEQEYGFIDMLFQEAKELRKEEDFDYFAWLTARADGYTNSVREVYNQAKLRAGKDKMVVFDGDDGEESCDDCQSLKGKRHKISWFVSRNYVPPFGSGLECHKGGRCKHGLFDDEGNQVTI